VSPWAERHADCSPLMSVWVDRMACEGARSLRQHGALGGAPTWIPTVRGCRCSAGAAQACATCPGEAAPAAHRRAWAALALPRSAAAACGWPGRAEGRRCRARSTPGTVSADQWRCGRGTEGQLALESAEARMRALHVRLHARMCAHHGGELRWHQGVRVEVARGGRGAEDGVASAAATSPAVREGASARSLAHVCVWR
jgi:hypothetical protein